MSVELGRVSYLGRTVSVELGRDSFLRCIVSVELGRISYLGCTLSVELGRVNYLCVQYLRSLDSICGALEGSVFYLGLQYLWDLKGSIISGVRTLSVELARVSYLWLCRGGYFLLPNRE